MFIVYDIIYLFFALSYLPYLIIKGKWHKDFISRCCGPDKKLLSSITTEKRIWIHAVSVGEVMTIIRFVRLIKKQFPQYQIICSTVTPTGNDLARRSLKDNAIVIYSPLDLSWVVARYINRIKPNVYISTETEIWPNLYTSLGKRRIPILLINGRISEKSFKWYRMASFFIKGSLRYVNIFCMQTKTDAERIISMGASPERVKVCGNLKFDIALDSKEVDIKNLGILRKNKIFVAGSTHPGEENIIVDIFIRLRRKNPVLGLIIAPRHIERAKEVVELVRQKGLQPVVFSEVRKERKISNLNEIVIVDEIGWLKSLYQIATIVFIGKTFSVGGGQNIIEPAAFGKPVFIGPMAENFKDVVRLFLKKNAIIQVNTPEELFNKISELLRNPNKLKSIGEAAKEVVIENQGATAETLRALAQLLLHSKQKNLRIFLV